MARVIILVLAALLAVPAEAARYGIMADLEKKIETGDWNTRIRAVNQLGPLGHASIPALRAALKDPDWQVRLTAVHWMGQYGRRSAPALRAFVTREQCPIVRLNAVHWLGNIGESDVRDVRKETDARHCQSHFWPKRGGRPSVLKRTRAVASTRRDKSGCRFVRYQRPGRNLCPAGSELRGVGDAPHAIKILNMKKLPRAGVALCCPPETTAEQAMAGLPKPREVECRLLPMECPPPWREMEPPDRGVGKNFRYRRTKRVRQGEIRWTHCCRPIGHFADKPTEASLPLTTYDSAAANTPFLEEEAASQSYVEEAEPPPADFGDVDSMPERLIALKALESLQRQDPNWRESPPEPKRVARQMRLSELEALFKATQEDLPRPKGIDQRDENDERPAAEFESPEAVEARLALEAPTTLPGGGESLPRPQGIDGRPETDVSFPAEITVPGAERADPDLKKPASDRGDAQARLGRPEGPGARTEARFRAPASINPDAGTIVPYNALPALMETMHDKSARNRARAAEAIGNFGKKGREAVPLLRKALRDTSARVRSSAALALGHTTVGSNTSVRDLKRALRDRHPDVRFSAAQALGRIGTPAARRAFEGHMRRETRRFLRSDAAKSAR